MKEKKPPNGRGFPDPAHKVMMAYPDGEQATYGYNNRMLVDTLSGASNYVTGTEYDAAGRVTLRELGNGLSQGFEYYAWNEKATVDGVLTGQGGRLSRAVQQSSVGVDEAMKIKVSCG